MTRLLPLLALGLLASTAAAGDRQRAAEGCVSSAPAGGCYVALQEERVAVASDGVPAPTTRQRFDRQGNAVDRRGRILAAPANGGRATEVFIDD